MGTKKLIGITGTYCSGKNHAALLLKQRGFAALDVDKLGHEVIMAETARLAARFGSDILGGDGFVDRKRLGAKVFGNPGELAALEDIIHPEVNRQTLDWIHKHAGKACVINAALLHRSSAFDLLDAIIIVQAAFPVRLLRAKKRDGLPWRVLLERFASQRNFSAQYSRGKADIYRVENSGFSCFGGRFMHRRLGNRIDEILSHIGM